MTKVAFISDLHFGTVPDGLADTLQQDLHDQSLDAVVVVGDMTQRARRHEYRAAAAFIGELPGQVLVVPGNHDIPTWNLLARAAWPYRRYKRHFGAPEVQSAVFDDLVVVALNTAKRMQPHLRWQEGTLRRRQVRHACHLIAAQDPGLLKIVATHHPLVRSSVVERAIPARRARAGLQAFADAGVDMLVSGHTHLPFRHAIEAPLQHDGEGILALGTPSALSDRLRGEPNGYWMVTADSGKLQPQLRSYREGRYQAEEPADVTVVEL